MEGQMSLFDLDIWSGKMYPEPSQATPEKTSKPSSQKSSKSQSQTLPMCLCLKKESGANPAAYTMTWGGGQLLGEYTMHSFGEQPYTLMTECRYSEERPNGVGVSHLSQILEDSAHPKYYLSEKACIGILNRAAKRGKELPEILKTALETQAGLA